MQRRLAIVVADTGYGVGGNADHFGEDFMRDVFLGKDNFETVDLDLIGHDESL